ncbi:iron-sulfur cluster insertion protein [Methanolobus vulcani]|jgi:iron-sulfur cluster insertion protein|uniref:Iron-sulfur cluster insertion protein n=1 Tax=Methanolobus vulcani TaxID=38026 RepID=A0A7Z7FDM3_9EURY|nr:iron-sulfur cluster assembly accessory protein [Methanolobus vulcani]SDG33158.1 iron-sulfur cluster insertion protein [Methanolobus vulcani]
MVEVTDKAAAELKSLLEEQDKQDHALRIFIAGMSCCGVQYGMSLENEISEEHDLVVEDKGLKIVMNKDDADGLSEAKIDYVDGPSGKGFIIDNNNGGGCNSSSCGGGCC